MDGDLVVGMGCLEVVEINTQESGGYRQSKNSELR